MRVGLVAGEASGDLLGAGLIAALRELVPDASFEGVAGPRMQAEGCVAWEEAEVLAVMGLVEPLREIPRLLRLRRELVRRWIDSPPDVFVGIDAPDFNLGLEKRLREGGIPTVHYVSPSVWAWRQRRVRKIARAADKVLCLFPFEKDFYDRHGVAAEFVGHPMAERLPANADRAAERRALGMDEEFVVAIMPGSRRGEVRRLGPVFAAAARLLTERYQSIGFVAPMANPATRRLFEDALQQAGLERRVRLLDSDAPKAIVAADCVLLASGTATLEAALLRRPMVAAYRLAPLTYWLVRLLRLFKIRYFTLPNQLTDEPLVPELLQRAANPQALADEVAALLDAPAERARIEAAFGSLRERLARGADSVAARAVLELARGGSR
ncbi:MAG: lipid-A-disaccharide synthase [Gammaproteobacteria bacterium]|nr:lipid-A-disaccharide synthase [Gammaproteobacteria bacterium]MDH4252934.1 lipid-A-disaccharide synthase [Gammaproteobacteria bacterium]MDH5308380.1 lipid-A-disaccharide synthase [Gammaproteobacteria bacterium]